MENLNEVGIDKVSECWKLYGTTNNKPLNFNRYEDIVEYVFHLNEDLLVTDYYNETKVYIKNGKVDHFRTFYGEVDDDFHFYWTGEHKEDNDGESRRLSVYDVYSERELL